jgi:hypothetical protein
MKSLDYERYIFRLIKQEKSENFDSFLSRLQNQARKCEFVDLESQMKDQILVKTHLNSLRQKAFEDKMTLQQLIYTARTLEQAERSFATNQNEIKKCIRCDGNHGSNDRTCPGKKSFCVICKKMGHLTRACKNAANARNTDRLRSKSPPRKRIRTISEATTSRVSPPAREIKVERGTRNQKDESAESGRIKIKPIESMSAATVSSDQVASTSANSIKPKSSHLTADNGLIYIKTTQLKSQNQQACEGVKK